MNEIDRDEPFTLGDILWIIFLTLLVFAGLFALCSCMGCRSYFENAGVRVRAGNVTAPIEFSEPTSSANVRLMFLLNGVDLYVTKGSAVELDYEAWSSGTWLTSATTQTVHVAVSPTNVTSHIERTE